MNYGVLGSGRWGTAIAKMLGEREEVYLWGRNEGLVKRIQFERENEPYLPGVELPYEVRATYDLNHVLDDSDVLLIAVPSYAFTEVIDNCMSELHEMTAVISLTTGFEAETGRRFSQEYLERVESLNNYYALAGPVFPQEVADEQPTSAIMAGGDDHDRKRISEIFHRPYFRVFPQSNLKAVEICSALKQVVAIGVGICDGLELYSGARSMLVTHGMYDIKRLAQLEGALDFNFFGIGGISSVLSASFGELSRNYRLGMDVGMGNSIQKARQGIHGTIEGIDSTRWAHERIMKGEVRAPLISAIYGILFEELDPVSALDRVITSDKLPEE